MNHNLNIESYSLEELFELLSLKSFTPTPTELLNAKRKVMQFHPDKSNISSKYFIFYKKVYDMIENYCKEQNKINKTNSESNIEYQPFFENNNNETIQKTLTEITPTQYNSKFNEAFEKIIKKPNEIKNAWFYEKEPMIEMPTEKVTNENLNSVFEKIKKMPAVKSMVVYTEARPLSMYSGTFFHDADEDDEEKNEYISSDPFSKLKYDDLRKVYRDQTVLSTREEDFAKIKKFASVDELIRAQNSETIVPMSKTDSEKYFKKLQNEQFEINLQKKHQTELQILKNEKNRQNFSSYFMQLEN
jgi:hypothetical protein